MKSFIEEQYNIELKYISETYFNDLIILSNIENNKYKYNILINNMPYKIYKYNMGETLLIPIINNLFKGDFNNIYEFNCIKNELIHMSILKRENNIIEISSYNFLSNNLLADNANVTYSYFSSNDINDYSDIYKDATIPLEALLGIIKLNASKQKIKEKYIEVIKNNKGIYKKYISNSLKNARENEMNFVEMNNNYSSIIETIQNINENNKIKELKK